MRELTTSALPNFYMECTAAQTITLQEAPTVITLHNIADSSQTIDYIFFGDWGEVLRRAQVKNIVEYAHGFANARQFREFAEMIKRAKEEAK